MAKAFCILVIAVVCVAYASAACDRVAADKCNSQCVDCGCAVRFGGCIHAAGCSTDTIKQAQYRLLMSEKCTCKGSAGTPASCDDVAYFRSCQHTFASQTTSCTATSAATFKTCTTNAGCYTSDCYKSTVDAAVSACTSTGTGGSTTGGTTGGTTTGGSTGTSTNLATMLTWIANSQAYLTDLGSKLSSGSGTLDIQTILTRLEKIIHAAEQMRSALPDRDPNRAALGAIRTSAKDLKDTLEHLRDSSSGGASSGSTGGSTGTSGGTSTSVNSDLAGTVTVSQSSGSSFSSGFDAEEFIKKLLAASAGTCSATMEGYFTDVWAKCSGARAAGCCPLTCTAKLRLTANGENLFKLMASDASTAAACIKKWTGSSATAAQKAFVGGFRTLVGCMDNGHVCGIDTTGCRARFADWSVAGSSTAQLLTLAAACPSPNSEAPYTCSAGCTSALRALVKADHHREQFPRCMKSLALGMLTLPATPTTTQRPIVAKLMGLKSIINQVARCYLLSGGELDGYGELARPNATCSVAVRARVVAALRTLSGACTAINTTEGTCSCSPGCKSALVAARADLTAAGAGRCVAAIMENKESSIARAIQVMLVRGGTALADCARAAGVRLSGFGSCSARGDDKDCGGLGTCISVAAAGGGGASAGGGGGAAGGGCGRHFTCKCKHGFGGKWCTHQRQLPDLVQRFRTACAANGDGVQCSAHGRCVGHSLGRYSFMRCKCDAGFFGLSCNSTIAAVRRLDALFRGRSDNERRREQHDHARRSRCTSAASPVFCGGGDLVAPARRNTCVARPADCLAANTAATAAKLAALRARCANGTATRGCGLATGAAPRCPPGQYRCADGSCNAAKASCPGNRCTAAGGYACADGVTCAKDEAACVAAGVRWNGCGEGMIACPSDRRRCVTSLARCALEIGCPAGKKFCGWKRVDGGAVIINASLARPEPECKTACAEYSDETETNTTHHSVDGGSRGEFACSLRKALKAGRAAMRLFLGAGLSALSGGAGKMNLTMTSISDSLKRNGAFKDMVRRATMLSMFVRIQTSATAKVPIGSTRIAMYIADELANRNATACAWVLARAAAYSVENIEDVAARATKVADCATRFTLSGGCECLFNITHLSTYGVSDSSTNSAVSDQSSQNTGTMGSAVGASNSPSSSGGGGGGGGGAGSTSAAGGITVSAPALFAVALLSLALSAAVGREE